MAKGVLGDADTEIPLRPPLSAASTGGDGELHHRSTTQELLSANDEKKKGANGNESGTARI